MRPIGKDITKHYQIACNSMSYTLFAFYRLMFSMCLLFLFYGFFATCVVQDFTQRKTHVVDYLPINEQAYSLCGEPGEHDQQIFAGLTGSSWISRPLKKWIAAAS